MIIKTNGAHALKSNTRATSSTLVMASGDFGGATATLSYRDEENTVIPLTDGAVVSGGQYVVDHGLAPLGLLLDVIGATGTTNIVLKINGVK